MGAKECSSCLYSIFILLALVYNVYRARFQDEPVLHDLIFGQSFKELKSKHLALIMETGVTALTTKGAYLQITVLI